MNQPSAKEHLAAILAADAAGYSRLMAEDEQATIVALDSARTVFRSGIEANHGRVIDMAGDSVLAIFDTANGAVSAALAIQSGLEASMVPLPESRRLRFRIGVHLGDIFEKSDGTVYGDGVNIAARLQALSEPGEITVSEPVHSAVRNRSAAEFVDQGEHRVKNIPHAVRTFRIKTMQPAAPAPRPAENRQVRFCRSFDQTLLAYAVEGKGPPLVRAPHWLTHIEYEWQSPIWRPWIEALSRDHTLVRMDERSCGLSDRGVADISFEAWVRDLEAVVDASGLQSFALLGHSQGAPIAIEYAVRHPRRVTHLVILGGYVRGMLKRGLPAERVAELEAQLKLIEVGWGRDDPSYRNMFAMQFAPGASLEQISSLSELQRRSATPEDAVRIIRCFFNIDIRERAHLVKCPALFLHATRDRRAPFEEGRIAASLIPGARLVPLETDNHILLESEPSFAKFFEELRAFVPRA